MIERLVENWLDRASERTFQTPFCYILVNKGYKVVHLTRHCAMEMGKDIIAVSKEGIPCAFQLKTARGGRISLSQWNQEISHQVFNLVINPIIHPSVDSSIPHKAYLVTNGWIEEEVMRAIDDMNRQWVERGQGHFKLNTIVKGELLADALDLGKGIWPNEISDITKILELFLEEGTDILPKDKLASLFENILVNTIKRKPSRAKCVRDIASTALICSLVISKYSENCNHYAEIEAWIIFLAYIFYMIEKWNLSHDSLENELEIVSSTLFDSLESLFEEIKDRKFFIEGSPLTDHLFFRVRITILISMMSIYALWSKEKKSQTPDREYVISRFCLKNIKKAFVYSEAAMPHLLAFYWYFRKIDATPAPDFFIKELIEYVCYENYKFEEGYLANPYYDTNEILPHILGINNEPLDDHFKRNSYTLESLIHIFIRANWKTEMKLLWPDITYFSLSQFEWEKKWDFFRWRNERGKLNITFPKFRQEWTKLKELSKETEGTCIPDSIKKYPILLLLFLCVFPHRLNAEIVRWLDTKMREI